MCIGQFIVFHSLFQKKSTTCVRAPRGKLHLRPPTGCDHVRIVTTTKRHSVDVLSLCNVFLQLLCDQLYVNARAVNLAQMPRNFDVAFMNQLDFLVG